jgi:hypothetical protein
MEKLHKKLSSMFFVSMHCFVLVRFCMILHKILKEFSCLMTMVRNIILITFLTLWGPTTDCQSTWSQCCSLKKNYWGSLLHSLWFKEIHMNHDISLLLSFAKWLLWTFICRILW